MRGTYTSRKVPEVLGNRSSFRLSLPTKLNRIRRNLRMKAKIKKFPVVPLIVAALVGWNVELWATDDGNTHEAEQKTRNYKHNGASLEQLEELEELKSKENPQRHPMEFSHYVTLLSSLATQAFTTWGLLATVSVGVIAFIGSVKKITIPFGLAISLVFAIFAVSNLLALEKNFTSRQVVANTAKRIHPEQYMENEDLMQRLAMTYDPNLSINIFAGHSKVVKVNFIAHIILDVVILFILVLFTVSRSRKHRESVEDGPESS